MVLSYKILWNKELPGEELRGRANAERYFVFLQGDTVFQAVSSWVSLDHGLLKMLRILFPAWSVNIICSLTKK